MVPSVCLYVCFRSRWRTGRTCCHFVSRPHLHLWLDIRRCCRRQRRISEFTYGYCFVPFYCNQISAKCLLLMCSAVPNILHTVLHNLDRRQPLRPAWYDLIILSYCQQSKFSHWTILRKTLKRVTDCIQQHTTWTTPLEFAELYILMRSVKKKQVFKLIGFIYETVTIFSL